tara:strand:+ start:229 stop:483 length:255 start_codon:yes stop_codon:yes gene_type:complete
MKLSIFFISFFIYSSPSYASTKTVEEQCILDFTSDASRDYVWLDARQLSKTCACIANNIKRGLNPQSCPNINRVSDYEIRRYFR